jgi:hypothetical protein
MSKKCRKYLSFLFAPFARFVVYYIWSAEGHEYPDLQVGDEVNPRTLFVLS